MYSSNVTYDPETEAKLDQWVQAKRARDFATSDAIQAELEAQGIDTKAARPDPKKGRANPAGAFAGANPWGGSGGTYDPATEARLDEWVQAKRARDFATSDAIQAELEAQGIDTHAARPDPKKGRANPSGAFGGANPWGTSGGAGANPWGGGGTYDPVTEAKLDQWVQAKRARDFVTSDAIQAELEAQGVDTKAARPDPKKAGANLWGASGGAPAMFWGGGGGTYDPATEAKLDQWVQAKRARDFTTSDAIQAELEAQGIDTKAARPDPRKAGANAWDAAGGAWGGDSFDPWSMMQAGMAMMKGSMMKGDGGKGWGKGRYGPY